jgi:hypothetical protein
VDAKSTSLRARGSHPPPSEEKTERWRERSGVAPDPLTEQREELLPLLQLAHAYYTMISLEACVCEGEGMM